MFQATKRNENVVAATVTDAAVTDWQRSRPLRRSCPAVNYRRPTCWSSTAVFDLVCMRDRRGPERGLAGPSAGGGDVDGGRPPRPSDLTAARTALEQHRVRDAHRRNRCVGVEATRLGGSLSDIGE